MKDPHMHLVLPIEMRGLERKNELTIKERKEEKEDRKSEEERGRKRVGEGVKERGRR